MSDERGGARLNFLIVAVIIAVVGYALYQYVPVAYQAFLYKDYMQETVTKASYPPVQTTAWVEQQLRAGAKDYNLPPNMAVNVQSVNGRIEARVQWTRPITLPGYVYQYQFDHTVRSGAIANP